MKLLSSNLSVDKTFVSFGGYAATGGSVLRDLLKEFDSVSLFPIEFRLIKEHRGLFDLKSSLFLAPSPETTDLAIKDFQWLCKNFSRGRSRFTRSGHSYDFHTGYEFSKAINDFIDEIVSYTYPMSWHYYDFKKSEIVYLLHKYIRILFKGIRFTQPAYMSTITEDQFIASSRRLLNRIFAAFLSCRHQKSPIIALHNAFSPTSTLSLDFGCALFDQFSMIIVDRDPRDIFMDLPKAKYLPSSSSSRAKAFVDFFLHTRKNSSALYSRANVLSLKFEDFIYRYDHIVESLHSFISPNLGNHLYKYRFFDPNISLRNIGLYHNAPPSILPDIRYIEKHLQSYIYQ